MSLFTWRNIGAFSCTSSFFWMEKMWFSQIIPSSAKLNKKLSRWVSESPDAPKNFWTKWILNYYLFCVTKRTQEVWRSVHLSNKSALRCIYFVSGNLMSKQTFRTESGIEAAFSVVLRGKRDLILALRMESVVIRCSQRSLQAISIATRLVLRFPSSRISFLTTFLQRNMNLSL